MKIISQGLDPVKLLNLLLISLRAHARYLNTPETRHVRKQAKRIGIEI